MPHALQSILGPMGPLRHMGVLPLPQHAQHFNRFATGRLPLPLPLLGGGVGCQSSWSSLGTTCTTCIHPPRTHQATNHFELLARRRCERHRVSRIRRTGRVLIHASTDIAARVSQSRPLQAAVNNGMSSCLERGNAPGSTRHARPHLVTAPATRAPRLSSAVARARARV
jgi:hypothetical protein